MPKTETITPEVKAKEAAPEQKLNKEPKIEVKQVKEPESKTPEDGVYKIDLRNVDKEKTSEKEETKEEVSKDKEPESKEKTEDKVIKEVKEVKEETTQEETKQEETKEEESVIELVEETKEETKKEETLSDKINKIPEKFEKEKEEIKQESKKLPENVDKLVDFMNETGGDLEDYVKLNRDYDKLDDMEILREYYSQSKPHLNQEEISFLIEDRFSVDEEVDEERDIKRKKLALKESIAEARTNLSSLKSKYYDELKLGSKLAPEQREAVEFYDSYKKSQSETEKTNKDRRSIFNQKTNEVFSHDFKGFEYKVGDKKYRYKVNDTEKVKNAQSDINTLVGKFVDNNNNMNDASGYHKALFTAMNADSIANHFYEQGRADALKQSMTESKNIDMAPRGVHEAVTTDSGFKVKSISGDDSDRLRIKLRK